MKKALLILYYLLPVVFSALAVWFCYIVTFADGAELIPDVLKGLLMAGNSAILACLTIFLDRVIARKLSRASACRAALPRRIV